MRYIITVILILISGSQAFSQKYEVGPFIGGANYVGDVGSSTYISPKTPVFGGIFKYNASPRHAYRLSLSYAEIGADDTDSHDLRRQERGYAFSSTLVEVSAGLEFTFWDFDLNSSTKQSTPYLYTGLNYYFADYFKVAEAYLEDAGNRGGLSIPMVLGYKHKLNSFMTAGLELGARYTFTDHLDGSATSEVDASRKDLDFGNANTNDWYVFTGIYITFYFGEEPCYNNF